MPFNKLRRRIEAEQRTSYDTPAEKISRQSELLEAALAALGGPVINNGPTGPAPVTPNVLEGAIIGGDPGDESEYQAGLGEKLPNQCEGDDRCVGGEHEGPHTYVSEGEDAACDCMDCSIAGEPTH